MLKLDEIKSELQSQIQNLDLKVTNFQSQVNSFVDRIEKIEFEQNEINNEIKVMKRSLSGLKNDNRINNLIIYNLPECDNVNFYELEKKVVKFLQDVLKVEITLNDINYVRKLGRKDIVSKPVLIKFVSLRKKLEVLKSAKNLKGSNMSINQDYSYEIRLIRKSLLPYLYKARSLQCRAFLRYDKLIINNVMYTLQQLTQLDQEDKWSTVSTGASAPSEIEEFDKDLQIKSDQGKVKVLRSRTRGGKKNMESGTDGVLKWLRKEDQPGSSRNLKKKKEDGVVLQS